jgi:hypothetical protein
MVRRKSAVLMVRRNAWKGMAEALFAALLPSDPFLEKPIECWHVDHCNRSARSV